MTTPSPVTDGVTSLPRGTVGFERKVQVRDYESAVASIFIQFDVDPTNEANTIQAAKDAFFSAQSVVLEQLGVEFEYDKDKGIVRELIHRNFGPVTEVQSNGNGNGPTNQPQAASGNGPHCPTCNGPMYDNRQSKTNPRQPDYRCKSYKQPPAGTGCEGVIWPPKGGK